MPATLSGKDVLGDPSTAKWCEVASTKPVAKLGSAWLGPQVAFDACTVSVRTDDAELRMRVGAPSTKAGPGAGARTKGHGLTVTTMTRQATVCVQHVVFADGVRIEVEANVVAGSYPMAKCEPVSRMADHVVAYLLANNRPGNDEPPSNTLRILNPCALGASAVEKVPAYRTLRPKRVIEHLCAWGPTVWVVFGVADDFAVHSAAYPLAGRETTEYRNADEGSCWIKTKHIEAGRGLYETATVMAKDSDINTACDNATAIATALWPALP